MKNEEVWFEPRMLELLHEQFDNLSPEFWHKVMNPMCGTCLAEKGRQLIENCFKKPEKLSD